MNIKAGCIGINWENLDTITTSNKVTSISSLIVSRAVRLSAVTSTANPRSPTYQITS